MTSVAFPNPPSSFARVKFSALILDPSVILHYSSLTATTTTCTMSNVSIDPVLLILAETTHIMSAMRKNSRWAQSGMATILGVPSASLEDDDDSFASKLGLKPKRVANTSVCFYCYF